MKTPVVICVDDDTTVLESLKVELRRHLTGKCLIETADDGTAALHLLDELMQDEYDVAVVVADYIMPGLRGDELLHQVRVKSPQTVNIMLSGQADLDAVGRSIQYANLYRFISKPWHTDDLHLTIAEAIASHRQSQQLIAQNLDMQRLLKTITKLNTGLENQVQERTAQLHRSLEELRELSQMKDDFLHAISHDLRTPVAGMLLVLKNLQAKALDQVEVDRSILDRMAAGCDRQMQMLENLLEAHSSDLRGLPMQLAAQDMAALVEHTLQDLTPFAQNYEATFVVDIAPDLPPVWIDAAQIWRVFENLVVNAFKHNAPGVILRVSVDRVDDVDDYVRCIVQDNGVGMSQNECDVMFERYRRGKLRTRHMAGIGLGLYISRQIILAHGGEIKATSQPGEGLAVCFTLPVSLPVSLPSVP
jgi:two-component system, sensor histidine kinase and response regulator